ncbi:unnamed protein product [Caenorhabditis brenneri]
MCSIFQLLMDLQTLLLGMALRLFGSLDLGPLFFDYFEFLPRYCLYWKRCFEISQVLNKKPTSTFDPDLVKFTTTNTSNFFFQFDGNENDPARTNPKLKEVFQFGGEHQIGSRIDRVWRAIFMDEATQSPYLDSLATSGEPENWNLETRSDHILMDHMGFGMGLCCLQVTFQAADVDEARILYDVRETLHRTDRWIPRDFRDVVPERSRYCLVLQLDDPENVPLHCQFHHLGPSSPIVLRHVRIFWETPVGAVSSVALWIEGLCFLDYFKFFELEDIFSMETLFHWRCCEMLVAKKKGHQNNCDFRINCDSESSMKKSSIEKEQYYSLGVPGLGEICGGSRKNDDYVLNADPHPNFNRKAEKCGSVA